MALNKTTSHNDFTAVTITKELRERLRKFARDNGVTITSIAETALEIFLDSYPSLELRTVYNKDVVLESIKKHKGKLKPPSQAHAMVKTIKVKKDKA